MVYDRETRELEPLAGAIKLNRLVNRPGILEHLHPGIGENQALDLSARALAPETLLTFYSDTEAGLFFPWKDDPRLYEGHYLFAHYRGKAARLLASWFCQAVFDYTPATGIIGQVPLTHRAARVMSRAIGCKPVGESVDCHGRSCITYLMER